MTQTEKNTTAKVTFIGAGPGDPELITLKGVRKIREAGFILYAGSLVPKEAFMPHTALPQEKIVNSAPLSLEETHALMKEHVENGHSVARIHTGDPSIYGAIFEQMVLLDRDNIPYEVVPGVSSAFAAAAVLNMEYTVPGETQTVMFTRMAGKTPVPELEDLEKLAAHKTSMAIFLSAGLVDQVEAKLLKHFPPETFIGIVYRAGWPDQKVFRVELKNLADFMEAEGLKKQTLIIVSPALNVKGAKGEDVRSILYGTEKTWMSGGK